MKVIEEPEELRALLGQARSQGKEVGFVPTMGSLHGGHRSLIRRAAAERAVVAVSVFVNPLQFGPGEDFESYPRDLDADCEQAEQAGAQLLFAPSTQAMYGNGLLTSVSVKRLSEVLEGWYRPGHFEGVATAVTKLLAIAGPCHAYFGEKDYQQLLVVRQLVSDLSLPVVVVACPTVREPDGLALSSRNAYLGPQERRAASVLYSALLAGQRAVEEQGVTDPVQVQEAMRAVASREERFRLDYAEVARPGDLSVPQVIDSEVRLLIAGQLGSARLIDNVSAVPAGMGG
ncbi:MAG: pantoate--beta-alanine ligase [Acidimicrobiales bacterium]